MEQFLYDNEALEIRGARKKLAVTNKFVESFAKDIFLVSP